MAEAEPPAPRLEAPKEETSRISLVWLVPLLALLLALGVAWRSYHDRGPLIEIVFRSAAGVEAGQTSVRFRDVTVGTVEKVTLSSDLSEVVVTARIDKSLARFLGADAKFWVVRPSVTAQGVTGIETVISGVYIEAYWDNTIGERVERFQGLDRAPLTPADQPGLRVRLRAPDGGSMTIGAPVLFKRIQVGKVEDIQLTPAGDVMIDLFIGAPNDVRLTEGTRFWNASGFSIQVGGGGASLNVDSLISLLQGGISFDTVGSNTAAVEDGHTFELYPSETAARQNLFEDAPGERLLLDVDFDGSVRGLEPGAPVEYNGIRVGEVSQLRAAIVEEDGRPPHVTLRTTLAIVPQRFGLGGTETETPETEALDFLASQVENGLRAQLASSGILTQTLYVNLAKVPDAPEAELDRKAEPNPRMPSAPSDVTGVAAATENVLQRVAKLPLEDVVDGAVTLLANINNLVTSDGVKAAPENLGLLLADARKLVGQPAIQDAPAQLAGILASARALVDDATQKQLVTNLDGVLATARTSLASIGNAAEGVPALLRQVEALSAKVNALPFDQLVASAKGVLDGVDAVVQSDDVKALPASVTASLSDLRGVIGDLRSGGAIDNVNASLVSLRQISDELAAARLADSIQAVVADAKTAVASVDSATAGLPALVDNLNAISNQVKSLPLEDLVKTGTNVLGTADALLASEGVHDLPANLNASLAELRTILADLNEGGAATNVNNTLASTARAADAVTVAAEDLPALVARFSAVADAADAALASVGPDSRISRETLLLLQEVRSTARSVNALVSALERHPNSVIFGR